MFEHDRESWNFFYYCAGACGVITSGIIIPTASVLHGQKNECGDFVTREVYLDSPIKLYRSRGVFQLEVSTTPFALSCRL